MIRLQKHVMRRVRRVTETAERGLTLVELLVAMLIFALLLVLVGSAFSTISKAVGLAGSTNNNISLSGLGMTELSKVIRFAATNPVVSHPIDDPAFVTAKSETLTVYSYVDANPSNPAPIEVTFSLNSSRQLVETRYSAYSVATGYWAFNTTPYVMRILTGTVLAPTGTELPLFSYQTADGTVIDEGQADRLLIGSTAP